MPRLGVLLRCVVTFCGACCADAGIAELGAAKAEAPLQQLRARACKSAGVPSPPTGRQRTGAHTRPNKQPFTRRFLCSAGAMRASRSSVRTLDKVLKLRWSAGKRDFLLQYKDNSLDVWVPEDKLRPAPSSQKWGCVRLHCGQVLMGSRSFVVCLQNHNPAFSGTRTTSNEPMYARTPGVGTPPSWPTARQPTGTQEEQHRALTTYKTASFSGAH